MIHLPPPHPGVYLPSQLIFHPGLTAAALLTWVQLRSLAWDGWDTPPLTLPELAAHLGLHPRRLTRHLALLQDISALALQDAGHGQVRLSFPEEPILLPIPYQHSESDTSPTSNRLQSSDHAEPASYFPARILGYISYEDDEHDPLYIEPVLDMPGVGLRQQGEFSSLSVPKPAHHTFIGK